MKEKLQRFAQLAGYLEYMCWHLDGPEQIKHLDALLELPQVRLVQVQPGANRPPCVSDLWLPQLRKIQAKGRGLIVDASTPAELETLLTQLAPAGLRIAITGPFVDPAETAPFLEIFKCRYGTSPGRDAQSRLTPRSNQATACQPCVPD